MKNKHLTYFHKTMKFSISKYLNNDRCKRSWRHASNAPTSTQRRSTNWNTNVASHNWKTNNRTFAEWRPLCSNSWRHHPSSLYSRSFQYRRIHLLKYDLQGQSTVTQWDPLDLNAQKQTVSHLNCRCISRSPILRKILEFDVCLFY